MLKSPTRFRRLGCDLDHFCLKGDDLLGLRVYVHSKKENESDGQVKMYVVCVCVGGGGRGGGG